MKTPLINHTEVTCEYYFYQFKLFTIILFKLYQNISISTLIPSFNVHHLNLTVLRRRQTILHFHRLQNSNLTALSNNISNFNVHTHNSTRHWASNQFSFIRLRLLWNSSQVFSN